jgi:hypothetical protein
MEPSREPVCLFRKTVEAHKKNASETPYFICFMVSKMRKA